LGVDLTATEYGQTTSAEQRAAALTVIQSEVASCRACPELCDSRKQTVFGVGNPNARICFVGEGPGADEDRLGEPFVGAAGQLLDKIIGACKMSRDDVYILNTVKCRPPGNRNPLEDELTNCWPFAVRQLEIIQPEFICCLGSVAAKTLLKTKSSISKLRGQFHAFRGSRVIVTYHPAYLLRTPTAKKHTWNDMKMLMAEMGVQL
jgi:DNA polymerase